MSSKNARFLHHDPRWTSLIEHYIKEEEKPAHKAANLKASSFPKGFLDWKKTNAYQQPQYGYVSVYVKVPLGDLTSTQLRVLAGMARKYVKDTVRTSVEQNLLFRWVSEADLPASFRGTSGHRLGPRRAPIAFRISPPVPAPIPANWASPLRGAWPGSFPTGWTP